MLFLINGNGKTLEKSYNASITKLISRVINLYVYLNGNGKAINGCLDNIYYDLSITKLISQVINLYEINTMDNVNTV